MVIDKGFTADVIPVLAMDPLCPDTLYSGDSGGGGVYKSADGGGSWAETSFGISFLKMGSMVKSSLVPGVLYVSSDKGGLQE